MVAWTELSIEPELNIPLLTKVLDHITANPLEWGQGVWATETECGTAACVAGWAVIMSGHTLEFEDMHMWDRLTGRRLNTGPSARRTTDGEPIADVARRELGLNVDQSKYLFADHRDLDDLWNLANAFSNGEIQRLDKVSA
jgi:hypothetical protein